MTGAAVLPVVGCARVPITACDPATAARLVRDLAVAGPDRPGSAGPRSVARRPGGGADVHLCNAYTLALADRDLPLRHLLQQATLNFPDGMSVVWANRMRHRPLHLPAQRVYGPDLFRAVLALGQPAGLRHYLLGSTPDTLAALRVQLRRQYPAAAVVGAESPPFRPLATAEVRAQAERISASGAQIVWVGLGTPRQDRVAAQLAARLPLVFAAVGAAFDFVAGAKPQAPRWMQQHGLEWTFRLATEPRRLWKRYLFGNARFVWAAARRRP